MDTDGHRTSGPDHASRADARQSGSADVADPRLLLSLAQRDRLRTLCHAVMLEADLRGEVRIRLLDDAAMIDAHTRYSNDPTTTDVLTFDLSDGSGARVLDVDLLLCVDEARRQAAARGHGLEQELALYALHGMLHCVGYDDHDEARFEAMHAEEDRILEAIGIGRTFATGTQGGSS